MVFTPRGNRSLRYPFRANLLLIEVVFIVALKPHPILRSIITHLAAKAHTDRRGFVRAPLNFVELATLFPPSDGAQVNWHEACEASTIVS